MEVIEIENLNKFKVDQEIIYDIFDHTVNLNDQVITSVS